MMAFELEDIKRLVVKPGEVLLVTLPQGGDFDVDFPSIKEVFTKVLPGVEVIVMSHGFKVEVAARHES